MTKTNNSFFKLYACCIPVSGPVRAIICDVQRSTFQYIPLGLYDILLDTAALPVNDIYKKYREVDALIIDEYFDWLLKKEIGFFTEEPEKFPPLALRHESPELINNAIIDIDGNSQHQYHKIYEQLDQLGCRYLQIRSYTMLEWDDMVAIIYPINNFRFRSVELITPYNSNIGENKVKELLTTFIHITKITFHSAPFKQLSSPLPGQFTYFTPQVIDSEQCCGKIGFANFSINIEMFMESHVANTCLNRKISIDASGNIKNCPSLSASYGSAQDTSLVKVAHSEEFKQIWNITKSQLDTCKVCEFRYICSDCRAYLPSDKLYSKPGKCNYNPYTTQWEN